MWRKSQGKWHVVYLLDKIKWRSMKYSNTYSCTHAWFGIRSCRYSLGQKAYGFSATYFNLFRVQKEIRETLRISAELIFFLIPFFSLRRPRAGYSVTPFIFLFIADCLRDSILLDYCLDIDLYRKEIILGLHTTLSGM
jgi:hypothetical protein